ncbi:hypothetical protein [Nonomuraea rubra]|uniref:hypothetical protein n=1 Tax=Nonomuraea rubra TaxID=46180 RepID=UPI0033EDC2D8
MTIGVIYDGGWWAHVSDYFRHDHPWRARISFQGLHDLIGQVLAAPGEQLDAHYVRARPPTPPAAFEGLGAGRHHPARRTAHRPDRAGRRCAVRHRRAGEHP